MEIYPAALGLEQAKITGAREDNLFRDIYPVYVQKMPGLQKLR